MEATNRRCVEGMEGTEGIALSDAAHAASDIRDEPMLRALHTWHWDGLIVFPGTLMLWLCL